MPYAPSSPNSTTYPPPPSPATQIYALPNPKHTTPQSRDRISPTKRPTAILPSSRRCSTRHRFESHSTYSNGDNASAITRNTDTFHPRPLGPKPIPHTTLAAQDVLKGRSQYITCFHPPKSTEFMGSHPSHYVAEHADTSLIPRNLVVDRFIPSQRQHTTLSRL